MSDINDGLLQVSAKNKSVLDDKDRLTMHVVLHYEHLGDQPTTVENRTSRLLDVSEQPYSRRGVVYNETPTPLDLGWFSDDPSKAGYVLIVNKTGMFYRERPSAERLAADAKKILLVNGMLIGPGLAQQFFPQNPEEILITSLSGSVEASITIYPR